MIVNKKITQLHNTTPEQFAEIILQGLQNQFNNLKKYLEPNL
jgi:hypothetical protein